MKSNGQIRFLKFPCPTVFFYLRLNCRDKKIEGLCATEERSGRRKCCARGLMGSRGLILESTWSR